MGSSAATSPLAGVLHGNPARRSVMDIRLSIRNDEHLGVGQFLYKQPVEGLRRPLHLNAICVFALDTQVSEQRLDLSTDWKIQGVERQSFRRSAFSVQDRVS